MQQINVSEIRYRRPVVVLRTRTASIKKHTRQELNEGEEISHHEGNVIFYHSHILDQVSVDNGNTADAA